MTVGMTNYYSDAAFWKRAHPDVLMQALKPDHHGRINTSAHIEARSRLGEHWEKVCKDRNLHSRPPGVYTRY